MSAPGVIFLDERGFALDADALALELLGCAERSELDAALAANQRLKLSETRVGGQRLLLVSDPAPPALCEDIRHLLSHDLRAPLASAISLAESGADGTFPATPELIARLGGLAEQALAQSDGVLRLLRAHSLDPTRFETVDLIRLIHEAAEECWVRARQRDIALDIEEGGIEEAPVAADIDLLRRAFVELIANAIEHGIAATRVTIRLCADEQGWTVTVSDQGPGLDAAALPFLFETPRRKMRDFGYGAGLALVRLVAEAHRGRAGVESSAAGSHFHLSLPR